MVHAPAKFYPFYICMWGTRGVQCFKKHVKKENADEIDMKPFDRSIDEQKEKQDMWLLYPEGALENKMNLKIPIFQMMLFCQILNS